MHEPPTRAETAPCAEIDTARDEKIVEEQPFSIDWLWIGALVLGCLIAAAVAQVPVGWFE